MGLKSLLLCSDEKIVRVLRRVLSDLEINVEHCAEADSAIRKLTRQRYEAIIVDCADPLVASQVLRSAHAAPCNKRAVVVAILDSSVGMRSAFDLGAHFVLYKPVSNERAKSSFRAARALMKRERRRNSRITIQIPVSMQNRVTGTSMEVVTTDLSEGGMAVNLPWRSRAMGSWHLRFTLPGSEPPLEAVGELAWEASSKQAGLRFKDLGPEIHYRLRTWINQNAPETEKDDPPVRCKLSDLSLGGCYLEIASPFPVSTRLTLSMRAASMELRAEGIVRVMHPDTGMGVEFTQSTPEKRRAVEKFLHVLMDNRGVFPDLLVEPDGLDSEAPAISDTSSAEEGPDPLLELFRTKAALPTAAFLQELRKQRGSVEMPHPVNSAT